MVILIEPNLIEEAKEFAEKRTQSLSELIRESLKLFLSSQKASQRSKRLRQLGKYHLSLKGMKKLDGLNQLLNQKYF